MQDVLVIKDAFGDVECLIYKGFTYLNQEALFMAHPELAQSSSPNRPTRSFLGDDYNPDYYSDDEFEENPYDKGLDNFDITPIY